MVRILTVHFFLKINVIRSRTYQYPINLIYCLTNEDTYRRQIKIVSYYGTETSMIPVPLLMQELSCEPLMGEDPGPMLFGHMMPFIRYDRFIL